jgi:cellulose synthase/poly-beta-1,6-N-acetylglucosamine synthase-like glycosyltransferase
MNSLAIFLFWGALTIIFYTYLGYPLLMYLRSRHEPDIWRQQRTLPSVSIIVAVHNGARVLKNKIDELRALDYPKNLIEFIVVSDGSNDGTDRILEEQSVVKSIINHERRGKAAALNSGMKNATGDILLFLDIRPQVTSTSLNVLLTNFADPAIGCAGGQVLLREDGHDQVTKAVGTLYWRYEQWIRNCESRVDSATGVYGGFYAVRRTLATVLPEDTILDDMLQPLSIVRQGYRSVIDVRAVVYDVWPKSAQNEFNRKVRTLAGNFQLIRLAPWLLTRKNRVRFQLISHKLFRLLVPALVVMVAISSAMLSFHSKWYVAIVSAQLIFYSLAAFGALGHIPVVFQIAGACRAFCILNCAAIVGFYRFLFTRGPLWKIWTPTVPSEQVLSKDAAEDKT